MDVDMVDHDYAINDVDMVDHDYAINTAENHYFNSSVINILDFNVFSNNEEVSKIINNK